MTNILNKVLIYVAGLAVLAAIVFIIFRQNEIQEKQAAIETSIVEQKNLMDQIQRSGGVYATKEDIEAFLKNAGFNTKNIKKDLKDLGAKINSGNVVVVDSKGHKETDVPSSSEGPENPDIGLLTQKLELSCGTDKTNKFDMSLCDPFGYIARQQNLDLSEKFGNTDVPIGQVGFSAWKEKPWSVDIRPRQYKVVTVVGLDQDQRSYYYNRFTVDVDGKEYPVQITSSQTRQEVPSASFHWWNPHLFLNAGGGYNLNENKGNVNLGLSLGVMSYGRYRNSPALSILQVGGGFDFVTKRPQITLAPVNVNLGNLFNTKLISNTYVGPTVQLNTGADWSVGLGLSLGL